MRPYRAIPIGGKDFVYGWLFERAGGSYIIPFTDNYHTPASFVLTFVQVIPETVGQFTGLKDKNGKEIYEGDIVKNERGEIGEIIFANGAFVSKYLPPDNWDAMEPYDGLLDRQEVIGNIHQPELMEQDNG